MATKTPDGKKSVFVARHSPKGCYPCRVAALSLLSVLVVDRLIHHPGSLSQRVCHDPVLKRMLVKHMPDRCIPAHKCTEVDILKSSRETSLLHHSLWHCYHLCNHCLKAHCRNGLRASIYAGLRGLVWRLQETPPLSSLTSIVVCSKKKRFSSLKY